MNNELTKRRRHIEQNFISTQTQLPKIGDDVEFVPRWRCFDIIPGKYCKRGFWSEDGIWDDCDVAHWMLVGK